MHYNKAIIMNILNGMYDVYTKTMNLSKIGFLQEQDCCIIQDVVFMASDNLQKFNRF